MQGFLHNIMYSQKKIYQFYEDRINLGITKFKEKNIAIFNSLFKIPK